MSEDDRRTSVGTEKLSHQGGRHLDGRRNWTAAKDVGRDACPQQVHYPTDGQRAGASKTTEPVSWGGSKATGTRNPPREPL